MKKVSVVIACYNHAKFLKGCVESVINQNYRNLEIILINDGSRDNSLAVMKALKKDYPLIKIIDQQNQGVVAARNNAIKESSGYYILPVDADDSLYNSLVISHLVEKIEQENCDLVYGNCKTFGAEEKTIIFSKFNYEKLLLENFISATSLYTRKIFDKVGGYKDYMKNGYEDWEFNIRVASSGKVCKLERIIFNYRISSVSRNVTATKKHRELVKIIVENNKEVYSKNIISVIDYALSLEQIQKNKNKSLKRKVKNLFYLIALLITLILIQIL